MSTYRKLILGLMITSALALVLPFQAQAAAAQQGPWVYAAKFICGTKGSDGDVVKGQYATTVNILNLWMGPVTIEKQAVIAKLERQDPGPISGPRLHTLAPLQAMAVDCTDIRQLTWPTPPPTGYMEGFLMIRPAPTGVSPTDPPLEVVAKYTARHRGTSPSTDPGMYDVETLDVEKILPKVWLPTQ